MANSLRKLRDVPALITGKAQQQAANKGVACASGIDNGDVRRWKVAFALRTDQIRALFSKRDHDGIASPGLHEVARILPAGDVAQTAKFIR